VFTLVACTIVSATRRRESHTRERLDRRHPVEAVGIHDLHNLTGDAAGIDAVQQTDRLLHRVVGVAEPGNRGRRLKVTSRPHNRSGGLDVSRRGGVPLGSGLGSAAWSVTARGQWLPWCRDNGSPFPGATRRSAGSRGVVRARFVIVGCGDGVWLSVRSRSWMKACLERWSSDSGCSVARVGGPEVVGGAGGDVVVLQGTRRSAPGSDRC